MSESLSSMGNSVKTFASAMEEKQKSGAQTVERNMKGVVSGIGESLERCSGDITTFMQGCSDRTEEFNKFEGEHEEVVNAHSQACDVFLQEQLRRDLRTGETPTRKEYPFSPSIPQTSPQERIVDRYRKSKVAVSKNAIEKTPMRARAASTPYDKSKLPKVEKDENEPPLAPEDKSGSFSTKLQRLSEDTILRDNSTVTNTSSESSFLDKIVEKSISSSGDEALADELTQDDIMKMKVTELRRELSARNCPQFGNKAILQARLLDCVRLEGKEEDDERAEITA